MCLQFAVEPNNLGVMYETGRGVEKDEAVAVEWYRKAAEQGCATAQCNLGVMYENGRGVEEDDIVASEWYRKAAEQGYAKAQYNLGWMYENGRGIAQSSAEAVKWFRKAAEQGNADALNFLGWMYANGRGVELSNAEAMKCYRKAAEQEDACAQYNLGVMYRDGCGGNGRDMLGASVWFLKAAEQGYADAQNNLGEMYHNGFGWHDTGGWFDVQDDVMAIKWYRKAANQGHADAQHNLGRMYESGRGVAQSDVEAVKWYLWSAEQGNVRAQEDFERARARILSSIRRFIPSGTMYHMTSINNLQSILEHGILAKNEVIFNSIRIDDISDPHIQTNIRENKLVCPGCKLHDYASFYINPRNAMLYRVCKEHQTESIVLIEVSLEALIGGDYFFSNMNAAVSCYKGQKFVQNLSDIELFDWQKIYAKSWVYRDENNLEVRDGDTERKMQAEILVPNEVPPRFIRYIHCKNNVMQKKISEIIDCAGVADVLVRISPEKFF